MSIATQTMVVNLQIGTWLGYRLDKEASRRVTTEAHADADAARVNKHVVPKEFLKPVIAAANAIRTHFYTKTLPWKDNGDRLLTRKMFDKFIQEHERLSKEFNAAVEDFLGRDYHIAKERAQFRMGDLFNANDYPSVYELQRKFYVNLDMDAVMEANDFRVELDESQLAAVRRQMDQAMRQRLGKAMQDVWARLAETLEHFAGKMGSDEIFRDSTVRNLNEIVDLLPDLNILDDANLERIRQDIKTNLIGYEPKDLRGNKTVRKIAADEANRIISDMSGFMRAFGQAA